MGTWLSAQSRQAAGSQVPMFGKARAQRAQRAHSARSARAARALKNTDGGSGGKQQWAYVETGHTWKRAYVETGPTWKPVLQRAYVETHPNWFPRRPVGRIRFHVYPLPFFGHTWKPVGASRHTNPRQEEEEGGSPVSNPKSIALPWKPLQVSTVVINTTVETYQRDCPKMQIGRPWKPGGRGNL